MTIGILERVRGRLIVSSQAMDPESPLATPHMLASIAKAAELGGAAGFRVDGSPVVRELRKLTSLPIIGIRKDRVDGYDTFITPSAADARELMTAGADIIAVQATFDSRPAESFSEIVEAVHASQRLVMADISTVAEAQAATAAGADIIATTLVGFTDRTEGAVRPPLSLVEELSRTLSLPVVVEGGIWTPEDVAGAFRAGAWSVVVGAAITAPDFITRRLVDATPGGRNP